MKKPFILFCIFSLLFARFCFSQELKKVFASDISKVEDEDIHVSELTDGIVLDIHKPNRPTSANYISADGKTVIELNHAEAYESDSTRVFTVKINANKFEVDIFYKSNSAENKSYTSTKTIWQIFDENDLILPKQNSEAGFYTPVVKSVIKFENKLFVALRCERGTSFFDTYFFIDLSKPEVATKINFEFPLMNGDEGLRKRIWTFIAYDEPKHLFIFSRQYILKNGPYKGQNGMSIVEFNLKFSVVRTFDFHNKPENDPSLEFLSFELLYNKQRHNFYVHSYVKSSKEINSSNNGIMLRLLDMEGCEVWTKTYYDRIFENYSSLFEETQMFFDTRNDFFNYKFKYALNRYFYQFDLGNGTLKMLEKKSILSSDNAFPQTSPEREITILMNRDKMKEYKLYSFGKMFLVLLKDKQNKYTVYSY